MSAKFITSVTTNAFTFYRLLLPLALTAIFFCISVQSLTVLEGSAGLEQKENDEKRAIPVRNPYSWMALIDGTQVN